MIGGFALGLGIILIGVGVYLYGRRKETAIGALIVILGLLAALSGYWSLDRTGDSGTMPSSDSPTPVEESSATPLDWFQGRSRIVRN